MDQPVDQPVDQPETIQPDEAKSAMQE